MFCIHKYKLIKSTGKYNYYECYKCEKRKFKVIYLEGYQPIDYDWINKR